MLVQSILMVIAGYLVGSIPAAYLVARWRRGVDIRQHGSGNVGAANTLTVVGKRWSLFVTIFDIGKGALMVWFAQLAGLELAAQAAVGTATIIGHNWPVFLRFQGGRGVFTSLGVITILSPWIGLIAFVYPYLFFAPFKQVSLGVSTVMIIIPVTAALANKPLGIEEPVTITVSVTIIMLTMLVRRLTAPRSPISQDVPLSELLLYRALFDRDIKDRKAWISHKRDE
ncbi:MAG: glycerol-3-phosphate acyltransferase [Dehalococcoidales bacterium]|nr:glycerol-3-phosphate acyltransferase [Dehalococcoidales bacterium]